MSGKWSILERLMLSPSTALRMHLSKIVRESILPGAENLNVQRMADQGV